MCGFVGAWHFKQNIPASLDEIARSMAARIAERGPDAAAFWQDAQLPLVMAHRRLAIRDLSARGAQPMLSHCGRWVIAYNGEIYNTQALTAALAARGVVLQGHSDTEVLLNALAVFGVQKTLTQINGMFAFSLWDKQEKKLYLVRDRLGIKPLYYGFNKGIFYFGSQLKAFAAHPSWQGDIDYSALASYFRTNYIGAPHSIFKDIYKLMPGHCVIIDQAGKITDTAYWSLLEKAEAPLFNPQDDLTESLHHLLKDAVKCRMVSDVPLGAFLSGGIDSSLVVALMQSQSAVPINTFTIGFKEDSHNEAHYAKQVANHLGTAHHELYLSEKDATALIPELPRWYDEPFADSSQLPTLLVSKLARQKVIVSLSGDGGDELFAGYNRYFLAYKIYQRAALFPAAVRASFAKMILAIKPTHWDYLGRAIPAKKRPTLVGDKAHKFAHVLLKGHENFYKGIMSFWDEPSALIQREANEYPWPQVAADDFIVKMQLLDTLTYLPDDILTKVDRASMAVSLEARVPLLDYRVVEFALRLPKTEKIQHGQGKWILRKILNQYVPNELINRPKMGFGVPIKTWLQTSLKEWANELLSPEKLAASQLNVALIRERWQQHQAGTHNWESSLWGVLMFQAWTTASNTAQLRDLTICG